MNSPFVMALVPLLDLKKLVEKEINSTLKNKLLAEALMSLPSGKTSVG